MPATQNFLAADLGAESGRVLIGKFDGEKIELQDVHRFSNGPVRILNSLHWDILRLFSEIKSGIQLAVKEFGTNVKSIGIDTWGVDYGLLDKDDVLLSNPYHYRDNRTDEMMEAVFSKVSRREIFELTGIQFMKFNTLFQLFSMSVNNSSILENARTLLMMPDLLNFWLTGVKASEFTDATTTQLYDPRKLTWSRDIFEKLELPISIMSDIIQPGSEVGKVLPFIQEEIGLPSIPVMAPGTHDTASAVAAVPAQIKEYAYISSGTWSLMGAEITEPIINEKSREYNFTNEGGVFGTFRFLKNIMGMWPVQECKRQWSSEGDDYSYEELTRIAAKASPFLSIFNPDHESFLSPGDMPGRIKEFCSSSGQSMPADRGGVIRMILEGLALKYRWTLEKMEETIGYKVKAIHVVGGGCQNNLLNKFTADATGLPVITGPIEATALGNILMQAVGIGSLSSLQDIRTVVGNSFELTTFEPGEKAQWDDAYDKFIQLIEE